MKKQATPVILTAMALLLSPGQAAKGQTAWYQFENTLNDSSGNGLTGTVAGGSPTYLAGRTGYGQAIHLTNTDAITWAGLPTPSAISVSLWVKLDLRKR